MENIMVSILISGVVILTIFNYLYRNEVAQITKQIGIAPPKKIVSFFNINILSSLLALLMTLLIVQFVK